MDFHLHRIPIITKTDIVVREIADFGLLRGTSAETSGGLLRALPSDKVDVFQADRKEVDGQTSWVVGEVKAAVDSTVNQVFFGPSDGEIELIDIDSSFLE